MKIEKFQNAMAKVYREAKRPARGPKFLCKECRKFIYRRVGQHHSNFNQHHRAKICEACLVELSDVYHPKCSGWKRLFYERRMRAPHFGGWF